jgi:hypothetical protein
MEKGLGFLTLATESMKFQSWTFEKALHESQDLRKSFSCRLIILMIVDQSTVGQFLGGRIISFQRAFTSFRFLIDTAVAIGLLKADWIRKDIQKEDVLNLSRVRQFIENQFPLWLRILVFLLLFQSPADAF